MKSRSSWIGFRPHRLWAYSAGALLASAGVLSSIASAVTIDSISGAYTNATLNSSTEFTFVSAAQPSLSPASADWNGAVSGDLSVNVSSYNGVLNGVGGPVSLSNLVFTNSAVLPTEKATFVLSDLVLSQKQVGPIDFGYVSGMATLDPSPAATTPGYASELTNFLSPASFVLFYSGAVVSASGPSVTLHGLLAWQLRLDRGARGALAADVGDGIRNRRWLLVASAAPAICRGGRLSAG